MQYKFSMQYCAQYSMQSSIHCSMQYSIQPSMKCCTQYSMQYHTQYFVQHTFDAVRYIVFISYISPNILLQGVCFIWNLTRGRGSGELTQPHPKEKLTAHRKYALKCLFSPDSTYVCMSWQYPTYNCIYLDVCKKSIKSSSPLCAFYYLICAVATLHSYWFKITGM